jgi:hypothetical protein
MQFAVLCKYEEESGLIKTIYTITSKKTPKVREASDK